MQMETPEETGVHGPPAPKPLSRLERRERAALDVLRTLLRDGYSDLFGAVLPAHEELDVQLSLKVRPGENWNLRFDPPVAEQIEPQLREHQADHDIFRKGAVYCFRCDSSGCAHAVPPSPLSVFRGYSSTGAAEWMDFTQVLIEDRDERVDALFEKPPRVLARIRMGRDLKQQQLGSFGRASRTYAVLGQVMAGYYASAAAGGRLALTFQIVETRGAGGHFFLSLNILAGLADRDALEELMVSDREPALGRARTAAVREVERIEGQVRRARADGRGEEARAALQQVPSVLRRLAESLERGSRQGARRTHHVERRRQENRPVHKALEDARAAKLEDLCYDEQTSALVARGAQGRHHVFNLEGRHITSIVLQPGEVELRLRKHRWRKATPEEWQAFTARLANNAAGGI